MALRFQTAAGIDRDAALYAAAALLRKRASITLLDEAEVLTCNDLRDRKAVMQFGELDIFRTKPGACVRLLSRCVYRFECGESRLSGRGLHNRRFVPRPALERIGYYTGFACSSGTRTTAAAPSLMSEQS